MNMSGPAYYFHENGEDIGWSLYSINIMRKGAVWIDRSGRSKIDQKEARLLF